MPGWRDHSCTWRRDINMFKARTKMWISARLLGAYGHTVCTDLSTNLLDAISVLNKVGRCSQQF